MNIKDLLVPILKFIFVVHLKVFGGGFVKHFLVFIINHKTCTDFPAPMKYVKVSSRFSII